MFFYLPSLPSGGFAIKKEYDQDCLVPAEKVSIKTENTLSITQLQSAMMIALTPQEFIQKVIEATETEDINKIEKPNFVDDLIDEMLSANQRVNYDTTPQIPVNSDPHPFAPVLQFSKSSHSTCTTLKEAQENQVNTVEQQVSTPCL